jgi:hypothetical protein
MFMKKTTRYVGKKQRSSKWNQIAHTGNARKHFLLVDHPISQPNLNISPIWTPIIAAEVSKLQLANADYRDNCAFGAGAIQKV